ncbi:hypothetical protein POSPLADRAFT_1047533 [Postia placenta MAD-698-R-SB12]|uniref:Peptidase A1 domain-containing protein n=1 Tax=Postia placenta MAD-698-R-SB12 TaxID=670580 RepID=A0A1X6MY73_9APHY|nr:hypothetical protein POSPLADRAFT_1047533 [Postia placenta MAD-698-R-SB12]OSX61309.1 hypothetical protein POSPLADRAFT_1047533 [Postia placenta MAD-698-R-SB12]
MRFAHVGSSRDSLGTRFPANTDMTLRSRSDPAQTGIDAISLPIRRMRQTYSVEQQIRRLPKRGGPPAAASRMVVVGRMKAKDEVGDRMSSDRLRFPARAHDALRFDPNGVKLAPDIVSGPGPFSHKTYPLFNAQQHFTTVVFQNQRQNHQILNELRKPLVVASFAETRSDRMVAALRLGHPLAKHRTPPPRHGDVRPSSSFSTSLLFATLTMWGSVSSGLVIFYALVASTSALRVPVRRQSFGRSHSHSMPTRKKHTSNPDLHVLSGYENILDVILDTGSPDFWISTNVTFENAINTSVISGTNYGTKGGQSRVSGYILMAEAEFGGFTVHNQTFVDVTNMTTEDGTGLLFPGSLSKAKSPYNGSRPVSNIFAQYPYFPPQFTMLFSRYYGNNITSSGGEFTFGDPISGYEYIEDAPAMPVIDNSLFEQYWSIHMDAIIINGKRFEAGPTGAKNLTAILDAGTPTALMDSEFVDMLYGADTPRFQDDTISYAPCDLEINMTFVFGDVEMPINPLDLTTPNNVTQNGTVECYGSFERLSGFPPGTLLLGDSFLRHVYTLYNHNPNRNRGNTTRPYVQMIPVSTGAHLAGGIAGSAVTSSSSPDFSTLTRNSYIILGLLAGVLVLVLVVLGVSCAGQRSKTGRGYRVVAPMDMVGSPSNWARRALAFRSVFASTIQFNDMELADRLVLVQRVKTAERTAERYNSRAIHPTKRIADEVAGYENLNDSRYVGEVLVSSRPFEIILDTGSHEFWLKTDTTLSNYTNTSITAMIDYGGGTGLGSSVSGFVLLAKTQFANFTIKEQAFINVLEPASGLIAPGINGIMGIAPPSNDTAINNAFKQANYTASSGGSPVESNPNVTPQFTMLMTRNDGEVRSSGGIFTLGDPISEHASVTSQPVLPIVNTTLGRYYWTVYLDGIKVNGNWPNGTVFTAVLDSGTPTTFISPELVEFIYGADAEITSDGLAALVSCETMLNVSFVIGGVEYPVNPLDSVIPTGHYYNNTVACTGAFQRAQGPPWDGNMLLLGDTFLRNVYALYNLNLRQSDGNTTLPFVQLLSVTDANLAASQFPEQNLARLESFAQVYGYTVPLPPDPLAPILRNSGIIMFMSLVALILAFIAAFYAIRNARMQSSRDDYIVLGEEQKEVRLLFAAD